MHPKAERDVMSRYATLSEQDPGGQQSDDCKTTQTLRHASAPPHVGAVPRARNRSQPNHLPADHIPRLVRPDCDAESTTMHRSSDIRSTKCSFGFCAGSEWEQRCGADRLDDCCFIFLFCCVLRSDEALQRPRAIPVYEGKHPFFHTRRKTREKDDREEALSEKGNNFTAAMRETNAQNPGYCPGLN